LYFVHKKGKEEKMIQQHNGSEYELRIPFALIESSKAIRIEQSDNLEAVAHYKGDID